MKKRWSLEEEEFIRNNYANKSDLEVANSLGRTRKAVQHRRMKMNIIKVKQGSYSINNQFFSSWSSDMAYVLGFIFGDGYISNKQSYHRLVIGITDLSLLEKIRIAMESNHPIRGTISNNKTKYVLEINNKQIVQDLVNLGVHRAKSLTMEFPSLPSLHFFDFVRGFFDADGHVNSRDGLYILFVCASESFIQSLSRQFSKRGILNSVYFRENDWNGIYQLYIKKTGREKFVKYLYRHSTIHLQRKKDIFDHYYSVKLMIKCQTCGDPMKRTGSNHKRCEECRYHNKLLVERKYYHMKKFGHLKNMMN